MPKHNIEVELTGHDGNAFAIMGKVKDALKDNGASSEEIDEYMKENKFLVNMMLFFKIVNLPALGRLNLRFLIEGKHLCYKCKKELGRFALKFSVSDCRKRGLKMPKGLTTQDDLCADCFDGLAVR